MSFVRSTSAFRRLTATLALAALLSACGGGGGTSAPEAQMAAVSIKNGQLTYLGQTNTMSITGYSMINIDTQQVFSATNINLAPDNSLLVGVPTGNYNCTITYSNGAHESAQTPGDPVVVPLQPTPTVTFLR